MGTIQEIVTIDCPLSQAQRLLDNFFRDHATPNTNPDGQQTIRLDLRVPIFGTSIGDTKLALCEVIASLTPQAPTGFVHRCIGVEWEPVEGPYPSFAGNLTIESDEDYTAFRLALQGSYTPPSNALGKAFDIVLGQHIAAATAHDLLTRIQEVIEKGHIQIEEKKPQRMTTETAEYQYQPAPAS